MNTESFSLSFAPILEDHDGLPTQFRGVAYSGGVIPGYGFYGDVAIDLATLKTPTKPLFALLNHDSDQRVGKLSVANNLRELEVLGSFSKVTPAGQQVSAEFAEGAPWEFSVGLQAEPELFKSPQAVEVNGQTLTVNTLFRHASVREVSFVPAGADPNTNAIAFAAHSEVSELTQEFNMSEELKTQLDSVNKLNADLQVKLELAKLEQAKVIADFEARLAAEAEQTQVQFQRANDAEQQLKAMQAELRLNAIKVMFESVGLEFSEEKAAPYQAMEEATFEAIKADFCATHQPNVKPDYFVETVTSGKTEKDTMDFAAQLFKQVAGVK